MQGKKSARFVAKKICRDAISRQKTVSAIKPCAFASKATKRLPTKTYSDLQTWLLPSDLSTGVAPLPSLLVKADGHCFAYRSGTVNEFHIVPVVIDNSL